MDELKSRCGKMIKNVNFNSISFVKNTNGAAANKTSSCKVVYCEPGAPSQQDTGRTRDYRLVGRLKCGTRRRDKLCR